MKQNDFITMIFKVIKASVENIVLPTGKNLLPSLYYALIIFGASLIGQLLGIFTFISWVGALVGVIALAGLCFVERSEYDEISRLYGNAKLRIASLKGKSKSSGTSSQAERITADNNQNNGSPEGRADASIPDD